MDEPKTAPEAEKYDIFLCTRQLPDKLTPETAALRQLCSALVGEGYKVFFPSALPVELTDEERAERIVDALKSSDVMVAAGIGEEGTADPVARKLWSTFRQYVQDDPSRRFFACFRDVPAEALPEELADAEPLDMSRLEFLADLKGKLAPLFPALPDPLEGSEEETDATPDSGDTAQADEPQAAPAPEKKAFPWKWVALAAAIVVVVVILLIRRH